MRFKPWSSIGKEERKAVRRVLKSKCLSGFLGGELEGGPEIQALERAWSDQFGGFAVSVNSATSGLLLALKAVGVGPGSKVICSPYSMSAGVSCILWLGAKPVFVDIDDTFCLDPAKVETAMTDDITAVLVTNLFGRRAANLNIPVPVIVDNAQAPFSGDYYGTITVDSFNVHKPMQAGEGGICTTPHEDLANLLKLLRNHGELANGPPGLNLRMTEITAAIAYEQLKKGRKIVRERNRNAQFLIRTLENTFYNILPHDPDCAYYAFPIRHTQRDKILEHLKKRKIPIKVGYDPLYKIPAFSAYATPCPNCELIDSELSLFEMYAYDLNPRIFSTISLALYDAAQE